MIVHRFDLAELPAVPWKNHGGSTRTILSLPVGADLDRFAWRVSAATISRDGPFSVFPGVERKIMLLTGDGVRLSGTHVEHRLDVPGVPFAFDGVEQISCSLLGRPSLVLNSMVRRGSGRARLDLHSRPTMVRSSNALLFSVNGSWQHDTELFSTGQGLLWVNSPQARLVEPAGPGQLAVLQWEPA